MTAFLGCAAPGLNISTGNTTGNVYHPKSPPGIETLDMAKRDLGLLLKDRERPVGIEYLGKQNRMKFPDRRTVMEFYKDHHLSLLEFDN